jgi:integrase
MAIYKRGRVYWYSFWFNSQRVQESTKQGNPRIARTIEAAHRTALAKGEVGLRDKKPAPTLSQFIVERFEPWAQASVTATTWREHYRGRAHSLSSYAPLASLRMDAITSEHIADFAAHQRSQGQQVSTVNASLRVLRRILGLATEWGVLQAVPRIKLLPGERHREHVVAPEEEARYLAAAAEPLASIAAVLADTGLRPDECFRLRWEYVNWVNGRHGSFLVTHGKTAAARRMLPMTPRVRAILEARWLEAGQPREGWVWPTGTRSGHLESTSIEKQHLRALRLAGVRPFVLYSLRHTFLTRLGASGCDAWTLARIAGHSSVRISTRYVHPGEDAVLSAMSRLHEPEPERMLPVSVKTQ